MPFAVLIILPLLVRQAVPLPLDLDVEEVGDGVEDEAVDLDRREQGS